MNQPANKARKFAPRDIFIPMTVAGGLVVLVIAVILGLDLPTDPKVHALLESIMQLMLIFIVGASYYSLRREQDSYLLIILLAFFGTFVFDFWHLAYSVEPYAHVYGFSLPSIESPEQSWLAPRLYLAMMLLLSVGHQRLERSLERFRIPVAFIYIPAALALLFVAAALAAWGTHPGFTITGLSLALPGEVLPGAIYLIALAGYIYAGRWKQSIFEVYLTSGLLVNAILHLFIMSMSQEIYDSYYAAAHFLKFISYVVFLAGLITRSRDNARVLLTEERQRSDSILEIVADGIFTLDSQGVIRKINRAGCAILGASQQQLLGNDIQAWIPGLEPFSDKSGDGSNSSVYNTPLELQGNRSDGSSVPLEITFNVVFNTDEEKIFVGVMRDISERRQRETELNNLTLQLETALAAAGLGSWEWDPESSATIWDQQSNRIFGLPPLPGKNKIPREEILDTVHPEDRAIFNGILENIDVDARFRDQEYRIRRKGDGAERWVSSSGALLFGNDGEVVRVVGVQRDVTQHKQDIAQLTAAREEAREASRVKSAFLANMSHEIRTPMNGVIGMLDVLQQSSLNVSQMEMSELIKDSSLSLLNLIDDILDFSKIEAGKLTIVEEPMSLETLVEGVGSTLDLLAKESGVELVIFSDPALPQSVAGDPHRLRQILINLVNNAIKFSADQAQNGRVVLRALAIEENEQQARVEFRVIDNGIGMDEDTQTAVFESFVQADSSTQRRFGGTGLGLTITQSLVQMMGGEMQLESAPGEGSQFSVHLTLPLAGSSAVEAGEEVSLAGLRCLLIEDPDGWTSDLECYLQQAGSVVERHASISQASDWSGWQRESGAVCIVDRGTQPFSAENLEFMKHSQTATVLVKRCHGEQVVPFEPTIQFKGSAHGRRDFLQAVSMAAGRVGMPTVDDIRQTAAVHDTVAPAREDSIALDQLILVVEDNSINQTVIRKQLEMLGYAADIADDGAQALEAWRSGDYGLILTDLQMPELDGFELTTQIRAEENNGERIPIIALSASSMMGEAERSEAAGADCFLSKPARLKDLEEALNRFLPQTNTATQASPSVASSEMPETSKPVELQVLEELVGGHTPLIKSLLADYRIDTAAMRDDLVNAWREGRLAELSVHAHKMKSSSNTIGALKLGEICMAVEHAGKAYQAEALAELIPSLEAELSAVDHFILTMEPSAA